jgi:hypothetical protein
MSIFDQAIVYDIETLPNCWTLSAEALHGDWRSTWEISEFRDDRYQLFDWLHYLHTFQIPMIGFNNVGYDYVILHYIWTHPNCTYADIYAKNQEIFASQGDNRFGLMIWANERLAPQVDLFLVHHFNNKAKTTSLKALQINMRSRTVVDSPIVFGQPITETDRDTKLIPYNVHDVTETKQFAHYSMKALLFREGLIPQFGVDVLNYNDTKIGAKILEQRLGDHVCYDRSSGRRVMRQTARYKIALADIIFPYIRFSNPEFQRVLAYMQSKVLTPDDLDDPDAVIKTKGVFSDLSAHVGGLEFHFGTGGIHGSVPPQRVVASEDWLIRDIDVTGLYPSIAIVNRLAPAHLGDVFVDEYAKLPQERALYAKGTVENASYKLAGNGTYGNSNNKYSPFYDPQFTMTITINGQLMLCMLAEWLLAVPTFQIIQINTDGITYRIHRDHEPQAVEIQTQWQEYTKLTLEDVSYSHMWIRDVNNYIARDTKGKLKQKGAYWHPTPGEGYAASISEASPPSWHKDLGNIVSIRAAVAAMVHGIDPETYIRLHSDPFDFMCRAKVTKADNLYLGGVEIQRTSRYYVALNGAQLTKVAPPKGPPGAFKRAPKVTEADYNKRMAETGGAWCETVCTKNKSKYDAVTTSFEAGWLVAECNDAAAFRWDNVNYAYYVAEARKLIIA